MLKANDTTLDQAGNRFIGHFVGEGINFVLTEIGVTRAHALSQGSHSC